MPLGAAVRLTAISVVLFDRKEEFHFDTELALNKGINYDDSDTAFPCHDPAFRDGGRV